MTGLKQRAAKGLTARAAGKLRFPTLFALTGIVFVLDLFIPDALPLADEIFLGLVTLLTGTWKDRRSHRKEPALSSERGDGSPV